MAKPEDFSKYETARILGARALQIAMNAPLLIKLSKEDLERVKYDALKIAEIEFESGVLPISVKKPFPGKKEEKLKRIKKEGEIRDFVNPEDEWEKNGLGGDKGKRKKISSKNTFTHKLVHNIG